MNAALDLLAALLLVGGAAVVALAALGVARLPDPFSRMHAAAKAGVAGAGLLLIGAGLAFDTAGALLTALAAMAFLVLTAPLASHALGRAAYVAGAPLGAAERADALAAVLRRGAFDGAIARRPQAADLPEEPEPEAPIAAPTRPAPAMPGQQPQDAPGPRHVLCCLLGGPAQPEATAMALALGSAGGALVTGLSGAGLDPQGWRGPVPVGGAFWAEWLAARSRARRREASAEALQAFQAEAAAAPGAQVAARHEEVGAEALPWLTAGHDLVVVPAGIGPDGLPAEPATEIAAFLARARVAPVLRVRANPARVRAIVVVVGDQPACGALAAALLRLGLWRGAAISLLPVAADLRPRVAAMVAAQAALLRAHGRRATVLRPVELDFEADDLLPTLGRFDLAVMSGLSGRRGGIFDTVRGCAFEATAATVPAILLP